MWGDARVPELTLERVGPAETGVGATGAAYASPEDNAATAAPTPGGAGEMFVATDIGCYG
jgi:hypothetical protein